MGFFSSKEKRSGNDEDLSQTSSSLSSIESNDEIKKIKHEGERETWGGRMDFLLSCIGFAVGLGNIWRFPYLCYKSGGGAFLIPYIVFLSLCGLPLFFMEISLGQFASLSPITVWRVSPLFKGLGYGMVIISGIVCVYYNIIITWTFYYMFMSMRKVLPWSVCGQAWNSEHCVVERGDDLNVTLSSAENVTSVLYNASLSVMNSTVVSHTVPASEEFWDRNVLERTSGIEDIGSMRWPLFGCLVLAWTVVFLCLCKGVKSSGKVVYVTATFPYCVLFILLIRGLTLPGALDGITFYLVPRWEQLLSFKVWGDAAVQIFYSVGMAWGSLITMSSYNKFSNNVQRDALIVPLINCGTSIFAGLVIFSVLGFMSHSTGVPIEKVVTQGPGLIFVVYPEAVARMPLSPLWAVLFFLMIFTIGLDSQFGMFETMTSAFIDEYPALLRNKKIQFTLLMCVIEFVLGVPIVFQGGVYILQVMDWYCSTFSLMLISCTECLVLAWIYGADRLVKDIELMIGHRPAPIWRYMWKYVTPSVVLFIWGFSVTQLEHVTYGSYTYPSWAIIFGWGLGLCSLAPLPVCAILALRGETSGTLMQKLRKLVQPAASWGTALEEDRLRYMESLTPAERTRWEAAQHGMDSGRYLQMRSVSPTNIIYRPAAETEVPSVTDKMLPTVTSASSASASLTQAPISSSADFSHLSGLLGGNKPPSSIC